MDLENTSNIPSLKTLNESQNSKGVYVASEALERNRPMEAENPAARGGGREKHQVFSSGRKAVKCQCLHQWSYNTFSNESTEKGKCEEGYKQSDGEGMEIRRTKKHKWIV